MKSRNKISEKLILTAKTMRKNKKTTFKCRKCSKTFYNRIILKRHRRLVHFSAKASHLFDSEASKTAPSHTDASKKFDCKLCLKSFKYQSHFKRHQLVHSGEKYFKCDQCEKKFSQSGGLNKHRKKAHQLPSLKIQKVKSNEKNEISQFKCNICNKYFKYKSQLKLHERMHVGEKPFKCDYCEKKFSRSTYLLLHKKRHTGDKPYKCEFCGKGKIDSLII